MPNKTEKVFTNVAKKGEDVGTIAAAQIQDGAVVNAKIAKKTITPNRLNLNVPVQLPVEDYGGGTSTTGKFEGDSQYSKEGMTYIRKNYDTGNEKNIRIYIGGAWESIAFV